MIDDDEGDDWDDDVDDEAASPRWAHDDEEDDEEEEKEEDEDEEKTEEPPSPSVVAQRLPIKLGSRLKVKFEGGKWYGGRVASIIFTTDVATTPSNSQSSPNTSPSLDLPETAQ